MANSVSTVPFYVAKDGEPLTGAAAEMAFESLMTLAGADKSAAAPAISEIGGGWYRFNVTYGAAPFDAGDLVGVIDADAGGANALANAERYIPVEVRFRLLCIPAADGEERGDRRDGMPGERYGQQRQGAGGKAGGGRVGCAGDCGAVGESGLVDGRAEARVAGDAVSE